jgi:sulfate transport system ATP-binding protein
VYGFLGDVNLFHGRAHEGEMLIGENQHGVRLPSPEHSATQDSKAFAYVRPHDLDVRRYKAGEDSVSNANQTQSGIPAKLVRAIVVGPIARLELLPLDASAAGSGDIIEAQIPATQFADDGFKEGETLVLTPRKARVFVEDPVWVSP